MRDMRKRTEAAWKRCPKRGKVENQIKAGYNGSGSQRCKCKECGIYYTIDPKHHEYPEETRELAVKMYYGGMSGCGAGKILGMRKSNVMNWIKKPVGRSVKRIHNRHKNYEIGRVIPVSGAQIPDYDPRKCLHYDNGKSRVPADHRPCCEPEQVLWNHSADGRHGS
jgi:transposase-like protein